MQKKYESISCKKQLTITALIQSNHLQSAVLLDVTQYARGKQATPYFLCFILGIIFFANSIPLTLHIKGLTYQILLFCIVDLNFTFLSKSGNLSFKETS